jgi:hypothetical protein
MLKIRCAWFRLIIATDNVCGLLSPLDVLLSQSPKGIPIKNAALLRLAHTRYSRHINVWVGILLTYTYIERRYVLHFMIKNLHVK